MAKYQLQFLIKAIAYHFFTKEQGTFPDSLFPSFPTKCIKLWSLHHTTLLLHKVFWKNIATDEDAPKDPPTLSPYFGYDIPVPLSRKSMKKREDCFLGDGQRDPLASFFCWAKEAFKTVERGERKTTSLWDTLSWALCNNLLQ